MNETEILKKYISKINETKDLEYKRSLLYSAYSTFILSSTFFRLNADIKEFLNPLLQQLDIIFDSHKRPLIFKDYVYKSRSLIIARFIRIIQHSNTDSISLLADSLTNYFASNISTSKNKKSKKKRKNSVDELLERFGRK